MFYVYEVILFQYRGLAIIIPGLAKFVFFQFCGISVRDPVTTVVCLKHSMA